MFDWLWQQIVASAVWEWILIPIGAVLIAVLKRYRPNWSTPILYGLGAMALMLAIVSGIKGISTLDEFRKSTPPSITADNLETNVRTWLDNAGVSVKKVPDPQAYFSFGIIGYNNRDFIVVHPKDSDGKLLLVMAQINPTQRMIEEITKMTAAKQGEMEQQLSLELAKAKIYFRIKWPNQITVEESIPITGNINEQALIHSMSNVDDAIIIVESSLKLSLLRNK